MKDAKCPYCDSFVEINHDDGYGYEEGVLHQQECGNCEKTFTYTTVIIFSYETQKADCLNGSEHKYEPNTCFPREYTKMECTECGETREPTEKEMKQILNSNQ